jgi:hypothetical protein
VFSVHFSTPSMKNFTVGLADVPLTGDGVAIQVTGPKSVEPDATLSETDRVGPGGGGGGGQALVVALTLAFDERLPAASNASTANVYVAPQERPTTVYDVEVAFPAATAPLYTV